MRAEIFDLDLIKILLHKKSLIVRHFQHYMYIKEVVTFHFEVLLIIVVPVH